MTTFGEVKFCVARRKVRSGSCFQRCPLSRTYHLSVTKSPLGLFKEISPKRNFFQGEPQSDCNRREGPSLSVSLRDTEIHSSCAQLTHKEFRALRSASRGAARGSAPTPRKPSRRLDPSFVPWVCIQILCQHNKGRAKLHSDHRNASFAATAPRSGGSARRKCAWGNVN